MWYSNNYRRHLLDMHIEDWSEEFLSQFSPEEYYENLKRARITAPMLYFQSHVGYCYYPTKSGHMHKAFAGREDMMKRLVELCHQGGMDVVGYYSPVYNNWAHDAYPSWRMVDREGHSKREGGDRYGLCCPNNQGLRDFVAVQIKEMMEYFDVEGMFYDMPFWNQFCYCDSCKARWALECGGELPTSRKDPRWKQFMQKRKDWMGDFFRFCADETRKYDPNVSVYHNYAQAASGNDTGNAEEVNATCDYAGGDLHSDIRTQSFACKFYYAVTNHAPFEYMTARCEPNLQSHTISRTKDKLELGVLLTYAHHGANLLIDAIDPRGTMNPRVYELFGEINGKVQAYEPYLTGEMVQDIGVYYSLKSKQWDGMNLQGQTNTNYSGAINSVKTMISSHIPVGVLATENRQEMSKYPFVILPNPNDLPGDTVEVLLQYVEQGGVLYFSNADETTLMEKMVGGVCKGYTESNRTYVGALPEYLDVYEGYDENYPLPFNYRLPVVEGVDSQYVAAKIVLPYTVPGEKEFASIHSNPPGQKTDMPALVIKPYGKGTVIWSAAPIENESILDYRKIMVNLVKKYGKERFAFASDAAENVELVRFDDIEKGMIQINAVALSDGDIALTLPPFHVFVRTEKPVNRVSLIAVEGEEAVPTEIDFTKTEDGIRFVTRPLHIFDMYQLEWK